MKHMNLKKTDTQQATDWSALASWSRKNAFLLLVSRLPSARAFDCSININWTCIERNDRSAVVHSHEFHLAKCKDKIEMSHTLRDAYIQQTITEKYSLNFEKIFIPHQNFILKIISLLFDFDSKKYVYLCGSSSVWIDKTEFVHGRRTTINYEFCVSHHFHARTEQCVKIAWTPSRTYALSLFSGRGSLCTVCIVYSSSNWERERERGT